MLYRFNKVTSKRISRRARLSSAVLFIFLCSFLSCQKSYNDQEILITADVNRDGEVDFVLDKQGHRDWTDERGAIFLNNTDSDKNTGLPDWGDNIVNGTDDLKDLALIRIKRIKSLPENSFASISVDQNSKDRIRLFLKTAEEEYVPLDLSKQDNIDSELLAKKDLELRIEARSFADSHWDGSVDVILSVQHFNGLTLSDSVRLRVAPFMLLSNLNQGNILYVREFPGKNDDFIEVLRKIVPQAGSEIHVISGEEPYAPHNIWLQDTMEVGYTEMPGQRMNVVLKANRNKLLDNFSRNSLLGPDFGWIEVSVFRKKYGEGRGGDGWLDWYGNLEVTPPLPDFPLGRVYFGFNPESSADASLNPEIVAMLNAQVVQGPALPLDTGWLLIQHVDEMISFIPTGASDRSFKVLVVDIKAMIQLLEKWIEKGYGDSPALKKFSTNTTVSSLLANEKLISHNINLQESRIEPNIDLLKKEFELEENDFIRIPALFNTYGGAVFPNLVNSLVLNDFIFASEPDGPVIDGLDLLKEEIYRLLSDLPLKLVFLDDRQYHIWSGNVHCATNVKREGFSMPWWKLLK